MPRDASSSAPISEPFNAIEDYRLPTNVKPFHYDLTIEPDLDAGTYEGRVWVHLITVENTTSITLFLRETRVTSSKVVLPSRIIEGHNDLLLSHDASTRTFRVDLLNPEDAIAAGRSLVLRLDFEGSLDTGNSGIFRSSFRDPTSGELKWVVSTQMEPFEARKAFPCFDEPSMKATFAITLIAQEHLTCLSNMDVSQENHIWSIRSQSMKKSVTFNQTPLMSTYLVGFAVGELNMIETTEWRVPIRIYATLDQPIEKASFALKLSAVAMEFHEKTFGVEYPLPKLDQIQTPGNTGGMDNWGIVTYGPGRLVLDEEAGFQAKQLLTSVIIHELAHQWFGNVVTLEFWDGLWLIESFASWAQLYVQHQIFPEWNTPQQFLTFEYQLALDLDANRTSYPVQKLVKRSEDINQVYDNFSLDKGESLLAMLVGYIGIKSFIFGIRLYLYRYAFCNSVMDDVWGALSEVSGKDIVFFMRQWTQTVGYPVLILSEKKDMSGTSVNVVQGRFLKAGPVEDTEPWIIPINVLTKNGSQSHVIYTFNQNFRVPHGLYKVNAYQTGFYRVVYPPGRLLELGEASKEGFLSVEDIIGLISDAAVLTQCPHFRTEKTSNFLQLLRILSSSQSSYYVWKQLLSSLKSLRGAWKFQGRLHDALLAFQRDLTRSGFQNVSTNRDPVNEEDDKLLKALLLGAAGEAHDPSAIQSTISQFRDFMNGGAISNDARDSVFAIAIRQGTDEEFSFLLNLYTSSSNTDLTPSTLLAALGHTQDRSNIQKILEMWLQAPNRFESRSFIKALDSMSLYSESAVLMWQFMKVHFETLARRAVGAIGHTLWFVKRVLAGLATREQIDDVKGFFKGRDTSTFARALKQCLDDMELKARWVEMDRDDVEKWLTEGKYL